MQFEIFKYPSFHFMTVSCLNCSIKIQAWRQCLWWQYMSYNEDDVVSSSLIDQYPDTLTPSITVQTTTANIYCLLLTSWLSLDDFFPTLWIYSCSYWSVWCIVGIKWMKPLPILSILLYLAGLRDWWDCASIRSRLRNYSIDAFI